MTAREHGFSLVETLVALVVLSLGLLGAWALLLSSLQGHAEARRYATATRLVRDMADRIRANPLARAYYSTERGAARAFDCDAAQPCDSAQRASADLAHFIGATRDLLPGSSAAIDYEPAIGPAATDRYAIMLRWRGSRDAVEVTLHMLAAPVAG